MAPVAAQTIDRQSGSHEHLLLCTADATHFTFVNSEWERVLGWTKAELLSHPFTDFIHPDDLRRTIEIAGNVRFADYEVADFENRYYARDGRWHWLRWTATADGAHWMAVASDTTAEHAASASALAAESSPDRRRGSSPTAWRLVALLVGVALAGGLAQIHFSGADSPPSWSGASGPPAMTGPVARTGSVGVVGHPLRDQRDPKSVPRPSAGAGR